MIQEYWRDILFQHCPTCFVCTTCDKAIDFCEHCGISTCDCVGNAHFVYNDIWLCGMCWTFREGLWTFRGIIDEN